MSFTPDHPQLSELFNRLQHGEKLSVVAREAQPPVARTTLSGWWRAFKEGDFDAPSGTALATPTELVAALRHERNRRESLERSNRLLEAQLQDLAEEHRDFAEMVGILRGAQDRDKAVPTWLAPASAGGKAIVNLVLSDLHFDEVVRPEAVNHVNAYNRRIAELRLERTFRKAVQLPRDYMSGVTYDGIVVHLAGDMFSGDIHEELTRTNEATPLESLLYWLDPMAAGLELLLEHYPKVHVVSVPGNHDRTTRKPVHKGRVETSLHYVYSRLLEREFAGRKRITWDIPLAPDAYTQVYDTRILTTHGDRYKGGSGIGGILVPILRGDARTRQRQSAIGQPYDLQVMGHFHQYIAGPGVLINGSLKGYDEYAWNNSFQFEQPQQALFLVTPEHGASFHMPIRCMDRKAEGW